MFLVEPTRLRAIASVFFLCCTASWAAPVPALSMRPVVLDAAVGIGYGLAIADVDGDGRKDVVLADKDAIAWYQNPGWQKHVIATRLTDLDHVCVAAADLDGDGKAEIAAGAGWNPGDTIGSGALFYLQPLADRTQRWEPIRLAHDPTIHRIRWARNAGGDFDLLSLPLHGRGNKGGVGDGVRFLAYQKPAAPKAAWTSRLLNDAWHLTHNFDVERNAGSGADAFWVAAREGVFRVSWEAGTWRERAVARAGEGQTPEFIGAGEVRLADAARRESWVATIEPMHGNQVVAYRPRAGAAPDALWDRTVLDDTLVDGHGLACADLLGLGRDQVVAGWRAMNRPGARVGIRLYVPPSAPGEGWTRQVIDDHTMATEDLQVFDADGDGDLDLVAAGRATKNLILYVNETRR